MAAKLHDMIFFYKREGKGIAHYLINTGNNVRTFIGSIWILHDQDPTCGIPFFSGLISEKKVKTNILIYERTQDDPLNIKKEKKKESVYSKRNMIFQIWFVKSTGSHTQYLNCSGVPP